jgi:hypothetical protein
VASIALGARRAACATIDILFKEALDPLVAGLIEAFPEAAPVIGALAIALHSAATRDFRARYC